MSDRVHTFRIVAKRRPHGIAAQSEANPPNDCGPGVDLAQLLERNFDARISGKILRTGQNSYDPARAKKLWIGRKSVGDFLFLCLLNLVFDSRRRSHRILKIAFGILKERAKLEAFLAPIRVYNGSSDFFDDKAVFRIDAGLLRIQQRNFDLDRCYFGNTTGGR